ncbi:hypothetical protein [Pseudomonas syringae]|uniref:hypothetical protein n=1 Tax=Pseudomonas syringae TaxID=317 RepID=UPI0004E71BBD|nr:hypothetical protein [Pseudomonas syringae]KFF82337.1 hypothetical protein HM80_17865 [Pseudomonas syringae pv. syringae]
MSGLEKALTILSVFLFVLCAYLYWKKGKAEVDVEEDQPLDSALVSWFALVFVFLIFCAFLYFGESHLNISDNIGQVGDFIGGLTNPVLSFLALLVLLRTTSIQTKEARKTSNFMGMQQSILEREKFENTFFQLLGQLESFCERHFRGDIEGSARGEEIAYELCEKYVEFSALEKEQQIQTATKYAKAVLDDTNVVIMCNRAMRVVRFLNNSKIDMAVRRSYASILRDAIYPSECIIISSSCFVIGDSFAELLKKWRIVDLRHSYFVCKEIEYFYIGAPSQE